MEISRRFRWCALAPAVAAVAAVAVTGAGASVTTSQDAIVAKAKAFVKLHSEPQTKWIGPTSGPKAKPGKTVVYLSGDQSFSAFVDWGNGIKNAAAHIGWKAVVLDGKSSPSVELASMRTAISLNPIGIITSADVSALQGPIKQAKAKGIPTIGIHGTANPGPAPQVNLLTNISSDPHEIGATEAYYAIADSNGKGRVLTNIDNVYAVARYKQDAMVKTIKSCSTCKLLAVQNIPIAAQSSRTPTTFTSDVAKYGKGWYSLSCCDSYYDFAVAALKGGGVAPNAVHLIGADGTKAAYERIRNGQYQVATVPEPADLFGWEAIDALVRSEAKLPPSSFVQPTYIVTKANIGAEGGKGDKFTPSNNYKQHYCKYWGCKA